MFSIRSIKKYLLSHDNYLTRLIPWLFTFLGGNKIKNRGDNRICISGNYLKKSRIIINGTGNTIQFGKNNHLVECSILDVSTGNRINPAKSITVGDRVWLGNNTTVLKGAVISNDSIVATGSIVTKCFSESNVILAGNPAAVVKKGVRWIAERM